MATSPHFCLSTSYYEGAMKEKLKSYSVFIIAIAILVTFVALAPRK